MELNNFIENYIKENHSELPDKLQNQIGDAIRAGYYFAKGKGTTEPVDENSFEFANQIYDKAKAIHESKDFDEEQKYDMIFSDEIGKKVYHFFTYYDPDTSYEEDVAAFMRAFKEYIDEGIEYKKNKNKYP